MVKLREGEYVALPVVVKSGAFEGTNSIGMEFAPISVSPVELTVKADDRGLLRCMNGMQKKFDGPVTMTIPAVDLPATCIVILDNGAKGAFSVSTTKTFNCTSSGKKASCK